ncbi:hypothetical protein HPB49_020335 [Dermacentor silvarum]|uniref:Uncharacterized protein n=1 Tax=Dermacentor silvarum TaxID=543639 RepID=A0ACB8DR68_DERSI|nr:hypothetical protein HPB49_020335 [Dermacentor silvarum]
MLAAGNLKAVQVKVNLRAAAQVMNALKVDALMYRSLFLVENTRMQSQQRVAQAMNTLEADKTDIRVGSADLVSSGSCTVSDIEVPQDIRPDDSACQEASSNVPAEHGLSAAEEFAIKAAKHNLTHASTNDILDFCRRRGIRELPKGARTVMKTERKAQLEQEGSFVHFGLEECIRRTVESGQLPQEIKLHGSIDCVPLYRSSRQRFGQYCAELQT